MKEKTLCLLPHLVSMKREYDGAQGEKRTVLSLRFFYYLLETVLGSCGIGCVPLCCHAILQQIPKRWKNEQVFPSLLRKKKGRTP
jgi:hypothetical protein